MATLFRLPLALYLILVKAHGGFGATRCGHPGQGDLQEKIYDNAQHV
jgi:hypothetical protein